MIPGTEDCLYIGKEEIKVNDSFYELPQVKHVLKDYNGDFKFNPLVINAVH